MISTNALYTCTVFSNTVGIQLKTLSGNSSCYVNVCVPLYVCLYCPSWHSTLKLRRFNVTSYPGRCSIIPLIRRFTLYAGWELPNEISSFLR